MKILIKTQLRFLPMIQPLFKNKLNMMLKDIDKEIENETNTDKKQQLTTLKNKVLQKLNSIN